MELLKSENLCKYFGGLRAVDDVDFNAYEGERVGIIGPNGAGKTTLINLLSGLYKPTKGRIWYYGEDITSTGISERVQRGIVRTFQLASVFGDLKVIENMGLVYLRLTKTYKSYKSRFFGKFLSDDIVDMAFKALKEVGLESKAYNKCSELSYGEQRRLEIMMALVLNPKVILIDEPFAGSSEAEIPEIIDLLEEYTRKKTVVIIDHKVSKITPFVDRLCVMSEGKILCEGKPKDVICDPKVRAVYWKYDQE